MSTVNFISVGKSSYPRISLNCTVVFVTAILPIIAIGSRGLPTVRCQYPEGAPERRAFVTCEVPATPTFPPNILPNKAVKPPLRILPVRFNKV